MAFERNNKLFLVLGIVVVFADFMSSRPIEMIDLSYSYDAETPNFPGHTQFETKNKRTQIWGNLSFQTAEFFSSEHSGTHIDAPYHILKNKTTIDQVPLEMLEGPGVVLDIKEKADKDRDAFVSEEDVRNWEKAHGRIPENSIVIMYSGWGKYSKDRQQYSGVKKNADGETELHYPGFSREACEFLINDRNVRVIGVDTLSGDVGTANDFPCHFLTADVNALIIENLANVERLPPTGSYVKAYPLKITGGSGAPARVIATVANPYAITRITE